jgi:BASS family bile acid:Na+ symporter
MDLKHLVILAFKLSIICTVFGFGLKTTTHDLLSLVRRPGLLMRSLLAVFVIMPVVAVLLARLFDFRPEVEIALIALSLSPVPPLLPQKEAKAGGDMTYALGLMAVLSVLAVGVVPLALEILERFTGRLLTMAPGDVAGVVLMAAILPLAAGMIVRALVPRLAERMEKPVARVATILLPLAAITLLVATAPAIWALIGDGTVLAMSLFLACGFIVGHVLGGPEAADSVVLALSTASRHAGIALSIASTNFPDERFGAALLLYIVLNQIAGGLYFAWLRRHRMRPAPRLA